MASSAPSPAPRRGSHRHSPYAHTPIRRRPAKASSNLPTSRLATPLPVRIRESKVEQVQVNSMDVDEAEEEDHSIKIETVFAKSAELTATFYAPLPQEVQVALRNADFFKEAYAGEIDLLTGFAVVASPETCFVWKYSQARSGVPICYIFTCPQSPGQYPVSKPFHALVPYGPSREPGLILGSSSGRIRFWDSLAMGLAGGDNFSSSRLNLEPEEQVTTLSRADPHTYIASTDKGRLFRLTLTATGGQHRLTAHAFKRPQPALSRLLPVLWGVHQLMPSPGNINAVALSEPARDARGRDLWALIDLRIQRWNMSVEGWEELISEDEVGDQITSALRTAFPATSADNASLDLELLDLRAVDTNKFTVLISHRAPVDQAAMDTGTDGRRSYFIAHLSHSHQGFTVEGVQSVPYQSSVSLNTLMLPRLQVIGDGKLIATQFRDAVTICARDNAFMDRLELKSASDRALGVAVVDGKNELLILTTSTMMNAYIDMDAVEKFDPTTGRADLIKALMTQAILYGSNRGNPLNFSFPPEIDAQALMVGAQQLSRAILQSDPEITRQTNDMQAQLLGRRERMSFLVQFINENAVLLKMSQRSRQQLASDAEKLYAAHQLWLTYHGSLGLGNSRSVLYTAVTACLAELDTTRHDEPAKAFFRSRVADLDDLLSHVLKVVRRSSHEHRRSFPDDLVHANNILLLVLQSAMDYRNYNFGVYGIQMPLYNPWTSRPAIIDAVFELYGATAKLVEAPIADSRPSNPNKPREQLSELAATLLACFQERLDWLSNPAAADLEPDLERSRQESTERFRQLLPDVLETLRRNKLADQAFKLAEEYRDFRTLITLCHSETVYPPNENPYADRIQSYLQKFKQRFANELYDWYIQHGELRTLYAQQPNQYLDAYFKKKPDPILGSRYKQWPQPDLSWMYHLGAGNYKDAADALTVVGEKNDMQLAAKHFVFSVAKLSQIAIGEENIEINAHQNVAVNTIRIALELVQIQEAVVNDLKSALSSLRGDESLEVQLDTIAKAKASKLGDGTPLQKLFKYLVRQALQGKCLPVEDVVELLCIRDNVGQRDDWTVAFNMLLRVDGMDDNLKLSIFRGIWRRVYLHDDWENIRKTEFETQEEADKLLRKTSLFTALRSTVVGWAPRLAVFIATPSGACIIPSSREIASRWPGLPPEDVEGIRQAYEQEAKRVKELDLFMMYKMVRELAIQSRYYWAAANQD